MTNKLKLIAINHIETKALLLNLIKIENVFFLFLLKDETFFYDTVTVSLPPDTMEITEDTIRTGWPGACIQRTLSEQAGGGAGHVYR